MNSKKYKISVIVPAHNEEHSIRHILSQLQKSALIDEIICVNDGSTDQTLKYIKQFPSVNLIDLKQNHGKGYALAHGVYQAIGDIIVFIDADLQNFNEIVLKQMVNPLLKENYRVAIGYPTYYTMDKLFMPLTGERAYFKKDLLPFMGKLEKKGYGVELFLNYTFRDKKIKIFALNGIKHPLKSEKNLNFRTFAKLSVVELSDVFGEMIKNKNPLQYLINAYFINFYLTDQHGRKQQIKRFWQQIKAIMPKIEQK